MSVCRLILNMQCRKAKHSSPRTLFGSIKVKKLSKVTSVKSRALALITTALFSSMHTKTTSTVTAKKEFNLDLILTRRRAPPYFVTTPAKVDQSCRALMSMDTKALDVTRFMFNTDDATEHNNEEEEDEAYVDTSPYRQGTYNVNTKY